MADERILGYCPEIVQATDESYLREIKGTAAGLVIGDRALEQRRISTLFYDLGSEWRAITGLPFVFAVWVSTRELPAEFVKMFNEANAMGLQHIDEIVAENPFDVYDLKKYYTLHLSYHLDERKKQGMKGFCRLPVKKIANVTGCRLLVSCNRNIIINPLLLHQIY